MADHVLVVDDDPNITAAVRDGLEFQGYRVTTATNGAEALRHVELDPPALILLDMRMPVMSGWEFAARYRAKGLAAPVVVMTAAANARSWADEIQADAVLPKPFTLDDLFTTVDRWRISPNRPT
jgi:two-component system, chemotaxis family, chemotaxis protein CheY